MSGIPFDAARACGPGSHGDGDAHPRTDAVLVIHAPDSPVVSRVSAWWQQLKADCLSSAAPVPAPAVDLLVEDLQGHAVQHVVPAMAVNRLTLPAGSYLVTARKGGARRGYYLSLAPGSEFDLFLNMGH